MRDLELNKKEEKLQKQEMGKLHNYQLNLQYIKRYRLHLDYLESPGICLILILFNFKQFQTHRHSDLASQFVCELSSTAVHIMLSLKNS